MAMRDTNVIIVGAGPTGLMLAGELALAGVEVALIERRKSQTLIGQRAGGLHARSLEVLDQRGIAERFLAEGQAVQVAGFAWIPLDISDFPTRFPHGLALWQNRIEQLLADWVTELGVTIHYGQEVTSLAEDDTAVTVRLADGRSLMADYLVGCDGGRSLIRKSAGIDFPGFDPSLSCLIAEIKVREEPPWGPHRDEKGIRGFSRQKDSELVRVMVTERDTARKSEPSLHDLSDALSAAYGSDYGVHSPASLSRFTDMTRQAAAYRSSRVLLAGDAAHVHFPVGGQGLNLGLQDAVNLGWKLAQVVKGISPEDLLDSYHAERHPVAHRVLRTTMAQTALLRPDARSDALRESVAELLAMAEPRKSFGAMMSGLDISYAPGEGHALTGRRMPDLDLVTREGPCRVFTPLHKARPVLIDLAEAVDIGPWVNRVELVKARFDGSIELPVLGPVTTPEAILIRPDGHVAWAGEASDPKLRQALATWFGPAISQNAVSRAPY